VSTAFCFGFGFGERVVKGVRGVAATAVVAVALGGGTAMAVGASSSHDSASARQPEPVPETGVVARTDLVETVQVGGALDYGPSRQVVGRGGTGTTGTGTTGIGTVTELPAVGQTITRGQGLYGVDGAPVTLLYGTEPFWRPLHVGVADGPDILELQQNLSALGYTGFAVDDHFGWSTEHAVERWQHDLGVEQDGTVQPSAVAVEPAAVRVTPVGAALGSPAGGVLMAVSGTAKEVTVDLPVDQAAGSGASVVTGAAVRLELHGGATTTGRIADVGTVAVSAGGGGVGGAGSSGAGTAGAAGSAGASSAPATIPVRISLDRPDDVRALDGAPVTVDFTGQSRNGVLAVPVGALLALAEGGFAVEVVGADGSRRLEAVTLGMFADGLVEVSGPGVAAGQRVSVAGA
jgi:peptidoglycan hydrolase-like protein with peptidoglycan-binding domain